MSGSATAIIVELSGINIVPSATVTSTARSLGSRMSLARLVGRPDSLRERLKQVPGHRAVALDERSEVPVRQPPADEVGRSRHRRRAWALVDHRELPERVTRAQPRPLLAAHGHDRLAAVDQEERRAAAALPAGALAGCEASYLEQLCDLVDLLRCEAREQGDVLDGFGGRAIFGAGHGRARRLRDRPALEQVELSAC